MSASAYDQIAEWYDTWVAGPIADDPYVAVAKALMPDVAGQRLCDLACGQGRLSRHLAGRGAQVVGVDLSPKLLAIARRYEQAAPLGIEYLHADVESLDDIAASSFDGVVCNMALMDIAELEPAIATVARILRPGGWFVWTMLHPCYHTPRSGELAAADGWLRTVGAYWSEGYWRSDSRVGPPGKIGAYHRTLSTYLNTMLAAGLVPEHFAEPRATDGDASRRPIWAEVPAVLAARCRSTNIREYQPISANTYQEISRED